MQRQADDWGGFIVEKEEVLRQALIWGCCYGEIRGKQTRSGSILYNWLEEEICFSLVAHQFKSTLASKEMEMVGWKSPIPKLVHGAFLKLEAGPKQGETPLSHVQPLAPRLQGSNAVCKYGLELHDGRRFHQDSLGHIWRLSIQRKIFIHSDPVFTFFFSFNMESSNSSVLPLWSPLLHLQEEDRHSFALLPALLSYGSAMVELWPIFASQRQELNIFHLWITF